MRVRKLSPTGDYVFGMNEGGLFIDSPEAVAQVVMTSLKLFYGEWYLDTTVGMPWLQQVFGYGVKDIADQVIINYILNVEGVQDLTNWVSSYDPATRKYTSISATLDTIYGQTQLQMQNLGAIT